MKKVCECRARLFGVVLTAFLCVALFSCDNFLQSDSFKSQLATDIAYASSEPFEIRVECATGEGAITTSTILSQKVTDEFNVEFKISSDYKFIGWKAYSKNDAGELVELSDEYFDFGSYNTSSVEGIYKASVKFLKGAKNIVIKPECVLVPAVSGYSPAAGTQHYAYAPIVITFNQPVEDTGTSSADSLFKYGTDKITITSGGISVTDCFNAPEFNETKTVLTLTPVYEKMMNFMESMNMPYTEVSVKFGDAITVKSEGLILSIKQDTDISVNYRYGKETDVPILSDFLACREEITDPTVTPEHLRLTLKEYTGEGSYEYEDILRNYVYNGEFYIWGRAYDEGSGVKSVSVTRKKTHLAEEANDEYADAEESVNTTTYNANSEGAVFAEDGNKTVYFCIKQELPETGIWRLNVAVNDECDNSVNATAFSVIYKDTFFDELNNKCIVYNTTSDLTYLGTFYYGPGQIVSNSSYTEVCGEKISIDHKGLGFYVRYIDRNGEERFEKFNESRKEDYYDQYHAYPAYHLQIDTVQDFHMTFYIAGWINGSAILLDEETIYFPGKAIFNEREIITSSSGSYYYYIYKFDAPADTYGYVYGSSFYSTSFDDDDILYAYSRRYITHAQLYGIPSGPYLKADLDAMAEGSSASDELSINDDAISIVKSGTEEFLDVTVSLDENWENLYDSMTLKCNYTKLNSDDDVWNSAAEVSSYMTYSTVTDGNSITLEIPTTAFYLYPYYVNASDVIFTLIGEKDGVQTVSQVKTVTLSEEQKVELDNCPPVDCKLVGIEGDYMILTFTDKESGPAGGTVKLNGKSFSMSQSVRDGYSNYYDAFIPVDVFTHGKNRLIVSMKDAAGVTASAEFIRYYNLKTVAENGVVQDSSASTWMPDIQRECVYWNPWYDGKPDVALLFYHMATLRIYCYDSSNTTWGDPALERYNESSSIFDAVVIKDSEITINCSESKGGHRFVKCMLVTGTNCDPSQSDMYSNYEIYYTDSNNYKGEGKGEYNMLYRNGTSTSSMVVASDAPVFIHTLATCHSYDEVKDYTVAEWESHSRELGTKQINFSDSDHSARRYNIPVSSIDSGECYVVIVHFADDSTLMSEVMVR